MSPELDVIDVAVIGAGLGGLCAAIRLRRVGIDKVVVLERAAEVGGTWRDNVYPGCACDVPSHLYSYSFAPNTWSRPYPQQQEIQDYILRITKDYQLRPLIRFNASVTCLRWLDALQCWQIALDGTDEPILAKNVITATGPLNKPAIPDIPGVSDFAGPTFHSSQWRHDIALTGRRVVVLGTGASAVQFVPEIVKQAAHVDVFQRTPAWVLPRWDTPYNAFTRWAFGAVPGLQRLSRWRTYWFNELVGLGFMGSAWMQSQLKRLSTRHAHQQISDPAVRKAVKPDFNPGCKRLLISNTWYPSLQLPHVRLVTQAIRRINANGVVDTSGTLHPCDVIIWGTGFKAAEFIAPMQVFGREVNGIAPELSAVWRSGPAATHLGITVAGFPNLFMLVGPNTGLGHNSIIFMIEAQVHYIVKALQASRASGGKPLCLMPAVQQRDYAVMQQQMKRTVWSSGCKSWYQNSRGDIDTLWPGYTWQYWLQTRTVQLKNYE